MKLPQLLTAAAILGPLLWLFGPALTGARSFAFRDAAHYYYPLFEWTAAEWGQGRIPLWNPLENCGSATLADATSSVFYPGKLLFLLPASFALRYNLYIVAHVLLAAVGAWRLARSMKRSLFACGACGACYAFGGSVVFQYCNVVFLVGAAWLPLALAAAQKMLAERRLSAVPSFGLSLAMMTLGGDPQSAYHAVLLSALLALLLWREQGKTASANSEPGTSSAAGLGWKTWIRRRATLLALGALGGTLLAAVQIFPVAARMDQSERAAFDSPRSLYEIPTFLFRSERPRWPDAGEGGDNSIAAGLFGAPPDNSHQQHAYQFSVSPWRVAELFWPNLSGRLFPVNQRWTTIIPAEGGVWIASLYMGLLPIVLAISACRLREGDVSTRWLTWSALLALVASFGFYGLGWLLHEVRYAVTQDPQQQPWIGQPVGGVYWLMVVLLPGYAQFRFPAKLLIVASLAASVLAAKGWDAWFDRSAPAPPKMLPVLAALSGAGMVALAIARPFWESWLSAAPPDELFGPLDATGAYRGLFVSLATTALLSSAFYWLLSKGRAGASWAAPVALLLTALDLALAASWMAPTAPAAAWNSVSIAAAQIEQSSGGGPPARVFRTGNHWYPPYFRTTSSIDRQREGLLWDRHALAPKYHLQFGISAVESPSAMASLDYNALLRAARQREDVPTLLGATYAILPAGENSHESTPVVAAPNAAALPRAWIVHRVERFPALESRAPSQARRRTEQVLFPNGELRDFRRAAVVETDDPTAVALLAEHSLERQSAPDSPNAAPLSESCRIVEYGPCRVEIEAKLTTPGMLVLGDRYDRGWNATVQTGASAPRPAAIHRTNRVMRSVVLPAGEQRIVFRYQPADFYLGAGVSVFAWTALGAWFFVRVVQRRRSITR